MTGRIETRLAALGISLPDAPPPVGAYVAWVRSGALVFVSGQLPLRAGKLMGTGRLGETISVENGAAMARQCAVNLLAQVKSACAGDLDRVRQVVRLGGFVQCTPDFLEHPKVLNGASDLMAEVFDEAGRHARFAVGAPSLPLGAPVEVEGIFEIR